MEKRTFVAGHHAIRNETKIPEKFLKNSCQMAETNPYKKAFSVQFYSKLKMHHAVYPYELGGGASIIIYKIFLLDEIV